MKISQIKISEPYEDRDTSYYGIFELVGWKFKVYRITHKKNSPADERTFNIAKEFAIKCAGMNTYPSEVYGLGYIILHKGMDSNFVSVNIWTGQNMLRTHSLISSLNDPYSYSEITGTGMNVCVWDALIHHHERNAWVENILSSPEHPSAAGYIKKIYPN